mmetsp:Transcript_6005/g.14880  ORF Transcript_6005/g.14880 Transcript_6005/m.14880 type:complete len:117 (+) Transcript_6005:2145-2495(+)
MNLIEKNVDRMKRMSKERYRRGTGPDVLLRIAHQRGQTRTLSLKWNKGGNDKTESKEGLYTSIRNPYSSNSAHKRKRYVEDDLTRVSDLDRTQQHDYGHATSIKSKKRRRTWKLRN